MLSHFLIVFKTFYLTHALVAYMYVCNIVVLIWIGFFYVEILGETQNSFFENIITSLRFPVCKRGELW